MLKWVSIATRRSAWLSTAVTVTATCAKKSTLATTKTATATITTAHMLTSKSRSINSAIWLLTTLYIIAALVQATNGFQPIETNNSGKYFRHFLLFYFFIFRLLYIPMHSKKDSYYNRNCQREYFLEFIRCEKIF